MQSSPDMLAIELGQVSQDFSGLTVVQRPRPVPEQGEVLIRLAAAPINPSDIVFLRGEYVGEKELPVIAGFEGSGTVVEAGGGLGARWLKGKRVSCVAPLDGDGTWAEYVKVPVGHCLPLPARVDLEQGAMGIVNPMTACALVDEARRGGHRAVVQTAAAGSLGRMILRLTREKNIAAIHVVRRPGQVQLLKDLGAEYVLDSSQPGFDESLAEHCTRLKATIAFEAISGEMTGRILRAMPRGARMIAYGALSYEGNLVDPRDLLAEGKTLGGFYLASWMKSAPLLQRLRVFLQTRKGLGDTLASPVAARIPMQEVKRALTEYSANMTAGKVLLLPPSEQ